MFFQTELDCIIGFKLFNKVFSSISLPKNKIFLNMTRFFVSLSKSDLLITKSNFSNILFLSLNSFSSTTKFKAETE